MGPGRSVVRRPRTALPEGSTGKASGLRWAGRPLSFPAASWGARSTGGLRDQPVDGVIHSALIYVGRNVTGFTAPTPFTGVLASPNGTAWLRRTKPWFSEDPTPAASNYWLGRVRRTPSRRNSYVAGPGLRASVQP